MKSSFIVGPFFLPSHTDFCLSEIAPLGFAIEWANPEGARRIPLFRHRPPHAADRVRLENLVFRVSELPFSIEVPEYQLVHTTDEVFAPLESLLLGLYRTCEVRRPVFETLGELVSCVSLHSAVTRPVVTSGVLTKEAEERGFRLNTLLHSAGQVIADIAWEPPGKHIRFHVCLCAFGPAKEEGEWVRAGLLGVSHLLSHELRQLIQGPPAALFSPSGMRLLRTEVLEPSHGNVGIEDSVTAPVSNRSI